MSIVTLGVILVALFPIFRERRHKKRYTKILRSQIRIELYELSHSLQDKLDDIRDNPQEPPERAFKDVDIIAIEHLEKLFENATYLSDEEFNLFDKLMVQYRAYTFIYLKRAINKIGAKNMKKTVLELSRVIENKLGFKKPPPFKKP